MINRYSNNKKLKTKSGKEYLSTVKFSEVEYDINDIYIISKQGDRLDLYAEKYYDGDVTKWVYIARANFLGKGTMSVEPNLQIRIPMNTDTIIKNDVLKNL